MADIRILVPEGTRNYIKNPSAEVDTSGYTASDVVLSRDKTRARFGISCIKVFGKAISIHEGFYYRVNELAGVDSVVTVSAYVRGSDKVRIRLTDNLSGKEWISDTYSLTDTRWQRIQVTGRCSGGNDVRLWIESANNVVKSISYFVDGLQMELKESATTYCDGDQPGCRWNIVRNASQSTRDPYTRLGGKWYPISGPSRVDDDIYVTTISGFGMPGINNETQAFAMAPGAFYQGDRIQQRICTMTFNLKNPSSDPVVNLARLHQLRQEIIDVFKPDLPGQDDPIIMEYTDGPYPVYIGLRYDSGLEGDWDVRNQWTNIFPIRFLATSPLFTEDSQELVNIDISENIGPLNFFAARVDGIWNNMNYGSSSWGGMTKSNTVIGKNGEIYFCTGTTVNNNGAAIQPFLTANYIAKWNGTYFEALGAGANSVVLCLAVAPDGKLYAGGQFTTIGGVAANYVAVWDGSSWSALGSGLDSFVNAISVAPDGTVYVGGIFTAAGGIAAKKCAKWNGVSWNYVGNLKGLDNTVISIDCAQDGSFIYFGGSFTSENGGGVTLNGVAKLDPVTNFFSAMGSGFTIVNAGAFVKVAPDGSVYAGGGFTASGPNLIKYIARWNGSQWIQLGSGLNSDVLYLSIDSLGRVLATGGFTLSGATRLRSIALWNGSIWTSPDIDISSGGAVTPKILSGVIEDNGDIYIGGNFDMRTNSTKTAGITIVTNPGTASVSPKFYIRGSGNLRWIENQTTGKKMYADLAILPGEEVTIDIANSSIASDTRGNLSFGILRGSDFRSFELIPGDNKIAFFVQGDTNALVSVYFSPAHWSADAVAREIL